MSRLWRILASVFAVGAGMQALVSCPVPGPVAYGPPPVEILEILSFSYAPPSPVHVGDTLIFTAQLEPAADRTAEVNVYPFNTALETFHVQLHDDGLAPDAAAHDGIFTGSGQWLAKSGTGAQHVWLKAQGIKQGKPAYWNNGNTPLDVLP